MCYQCNDCNSCKFKALVLQFSVHEKIIAYVSMVRLMCHFIQCPLKVIGCTTSLIRVSRTCQFVYYIAKKLLTIIIIITCKHKVQHTRMIS